MNLSDEAGNVALILGSQGKPKIQSWKFIRCSRHSNLDHHRKRECSHLLVVSYDVSSTLYKDGMTSMESYSLVMITEKMV